MPQHPSSSQSSSPQSRTSQKSRTAQKSHRALGNTPHTARNVAWDALLILLDNGRTTDLALEKAGWKKLTPNDKAFVKRLLLTTLRFFYPLWNVLTEFLSRPLEDNSRGDKLGAILLLGTCELLVLKTPPHAAISSALHLAETDTETLPIKALLNGVLRNIDRQRDRALPLLENTSILPPWLAVRWKKIYGAETLSHIEESLRHPPSLDLTIKDPASATLFAESLKGTVLPTGTLRLHTLSDVRNLDGYDEGAWWIQNAAAALAVPLLGDIRGKTVLDICAAPGGKTMQLATRGALVTALDSNPDRLNRVQDNLDRTRLGSNVQLICADATQWIPNLQDTIPSEWDYVLVDAPCSATGTLRRHPEMLLQRQADSLLQTTPFLQRDILGYMADFVKKGGILLYVTCSLEPEEGEDIIHDFLEKTKGTFVRDPITSDEVKGLEESLTPTGDVRVLPHHGGQGGMDGFFIARLKRSLS